MHPLTDMARRRSVPKGCSPRPGDRVRQRSPKGLLTMGMLTQLVGFNQEPETPNHEVHVGGNRKVVTSWLLRESC